MKSLVRRRLVVESAKRVQFLSQGTELSPRKLQTFGSTLHSEWHGDNSSLVRTPLNGMIMKTKLSHVPRSSGMAFVLSSIWIRPAKVSCPDCFSGAQGMKMYSVKDRASVQPTWKKVHSRICGTCQSY